MNQTYIVVDKWVESYENPIVLKKGEKVIVDPSVIDSDPEWANWIWCIASDNRDGWVPTQILKTRSSTFDEKYSSIVLEDYSAYELSVAEGELLHGSRMLNGWLWCCKENSETKGWVPLRNLKLIEFIFIKGLAYMIISSLQNNTFYILLNIRCLKYGILTS